MLSGIKKGPYIIIKLLILPVRWKQTGILSNQYQTDKMNIKLVNNKILQTPLISINKYQ